MRQSNSSSTLLINPALEEVGKITSFIRDRIQVVSPGGSSSLEHAKNRGHTTVNVEDQEEYTTTFWGNDPENVHVVFSTDCTPYQDWQSLVVFHSAVVVGQRGPITRIASGCDEVKKAELLQLYSKLYPQYSVHFTPDYKHDTKTNKKCTF